MNTNYILVAVVLVLVFGFLLAATFSRRRRSQKFQKTYGPEYDRIVKDMGSAKNAQTELERRQRHVDTLDIRPLSVAERESYLAMWTRIQAKFVDHPGQATVEADHLITEIMHVRAYPISDFDQRAADISASYPALVSNYRAAREIALKNELHQANTEELRQAFINFRSLIDELLSTEAVTPEKKLA